MDNLKVLLAPRKLEQLLVKMSLSFAANGVSTVLIFKRANIIRVLHVYNKGIDLDWEFPGAHHKTNFGLLSQVAFKKVTLKDYIYLSLFSKDHVQRI